METSAHTSKPQERIPVDPGQPLILTIQNPSGDIVVGVADRPDVLVSYAAPHSGGGLDGNGHGLIVEVNGNQIEVRAESPMGGGWGSFTGEFDLDAMIGHLSKAFNWSGHGLAGRVEQARSLIGRSSGIDINVEIPVALSTRLQISSASGDVRVHDVAGEITLNTMSGDVQVRSARGDLVIRTANGDLSLDGTSGHLTAHTASGDVRVSASVLDGGHLQTANGDILLDQVMLGDRPLQVQTVNGDVRLALQRVAGSGEEPSATLTFQTIAGDAHVDPPFRKTGRRVWQAGAAPGPQIDVKTVNGDLSAGIVPIAPPAAPVPYESAFVAPPAEDVAASPPTRDALPATAPELVAPTPAADAATRLAVLEAVERGEIDIEEALRRLEASDTAAQP